MASHIEESTLEKAFVMAWNGILENKDYFLRKWKKQEQSENLLEVYRAKDFQGLVTETIAEEKMKLDIMLKILDCIKAYSNGILVVVFMEGTEIECRREYDLN